MKRTLHIALCAAAIISSAGSLYMLGELGATRWTMALNTLSIVLILLAITTRKVPPP